MGLIKAAFTSVDTMLADQWKEYFICEALPNNVLLRKGEKRTSSRSSNVKGSENIISNGSGIVVADGQCMLIVDQGQVVEVCAEPGLFTYDHSSEPSIFYGSLGKNIVETFKRLGGRIAYGGDTGKDQRVYYINTKEILDNKFGTSSPIMFDVVNKHIGMRRTVQVRCNGIYSYRITDPLIFYTKLCGNETYEFTRDRIDSQMKMEFISALTPALAAMSELELRPAQIPAKVTELKAAMNEALRAEWVESRGITVEKIAMNTPTLTPEDMKKINELEDAVNMGQNPFAMAGRMTDATAKAMETAAGNSAGAMTGFLGLGMAGNAMGGGFNAAQQFYNMGAQQQAATPAPAPAPVAPAAPAADSWTCSCGATASGKFCAECGGKKPEPKVADGWTCACGAVVSGKFCTECGAKKPEDGWTCSCGAVNKGKFCSECGSKKPSGVPQYKCDKCGWQPADPTKAPRFCPECGDPFDNGDII